MAQWIAGARWEAAQLEVLRGAGQRGGEHGPMLVVHWEGRSWERGKVETQTPAALQALCAGTGEQAPPSRGEGTPPTQGLPTISEQPDRRAPWGWSDSSWR